MPTKKEIRKHTLQVRGSLSAQERVAKSRVITSVLREQTVLLASTGKAVMLYSSFGSEFLTDQLIETVLEQGHQLVLPALSADRRSMQVYQITDPLSDLAPGVFGIQEPVCRKHAVSLDRIGAILMPGVAFDAQGNRVGYGAAYYDRFLATASGALPLKIAACFSCQILEQVPHEDHDILCDQVVTEFGIISSCSQ